MNDLVQEAPKAIKIKEKINNNGFIEWIVGPNDQYIPTLKITTISKLLPGKYKIEWNGVYNEWMFVKQSINLDELLNLPNSVFNEILEDINYFWDNKHLFNKYKFAYKRGILLWGNPGCGKSSLTALLSQQVINKNGIVISINNSEDLQRYLSAMSSIFRKIEPDTPVLVLYEDLDGLVRNSEVETLLLNILDGMNQSENVVNIGCTNYPENLKERVLNRPSRFDKRYYIGLPDASVRKFYFENKIFPEDIERMGGESFLTKIVSETESLTLSHLGEFIKSVFIFNNDVDSTISLLKDMSKNISSTKNQGVKSMGFANK